MSKYFFKGIDIKTIIDTGNTVISNNYIGFPTSTEPLYPIIERPLELGFVDNSGAYAPSNNSYLNTTTKDLSNRCKIFPYIYNTATTGGSYDATNNSYKFNLGIPSGAKYISGYCVGGGGGGGGAGGGGWKSLNSTDGGNGGTGGSGNYSAIVLYDLSGNKATNVNITVGAGGAGGAGGEVSSHGAKSNAGKSGNSGTNGGDSYITFNDAGGAICFGGSGNAGNYGGSGNTGSNGDNGNNGTSDTGSYSGGKTGTTTYNSPYPPYTAAGGAQGNGGNNSGNDGLPGENGIVTVYFLYN